jgi:N-acyl-D-amino-acid deacylase
MYSRPNCRQFIQIGSAASVGLALFPGSLIEAVSDFDLVIQGGTVFDGTGGPPFFADIGLVGDTIAAVGKIAPDQARTTIDASEMAVCPGFLDIHSHSDYTILRYPTALSRVRQGVTTEITGNCGASMAPLKGMAVDVISDELEVESGIEISWTDFDSFCTLVEDTGVSANQAMLVGHGVLRMGITAMDDRPMSADELRQAIQSLEQSLDEGA